MSVVVSSLASRSGGPGTIPVSLKYCKNPSNQQSEAEKRLNILKRAIKIILIHNNKKK